jgi:hypothetical protein
VARLNLISDFLSLISYEAPKRDKVKLPSRDKKHAYDDETTINALDRGEVLILSASLAQPEQGFEPAQELGSFCLRWNGRLAIATISCAA